MNKRGAIAFLGILAIVVASFAYAWMISSDEGILQLGPKVTKVSSTSVQMKACGKLRFNPARLYCADTSKSILCHLGESLCGTKCYSSSKGKCVSAEKSIVCGKSEVLCGDRCMKSCGKTVSSRGVVALGGSCTTDDDCGELDICVNRVCKEVGAVPDGGTCTVDEECEDLKCVRRKCSDGSLGTICECDIDGGDSCDVNYDVYCNKASRKCEAWGSPGEKCGPVCDEDVIACNDLAYLFGCIRGKCSNGSAGMTCDEDYIPNCDSDNYCNNGVCAPLIIQGSKCTSIEQCGNGNSCINKICSPGVSGSSCVSDNNCNSDNYCNIQDICTLGAKLGESCTMIWDINSLTNSIYCAKNLYCVRNKCSIDSCYDSDGTDYNVKGNVYDIYGSYSDFCHNSSSLLEITCKVQESAWDMNVKFGIDYNCPSGSSCVDGACVVPAPPVCGDGKKTGNEVCDIKGNVGCGSGLVCAPGCKSCQQSGIITISNLIPNGGTFPVGNVGLSWKVSSTITNVPDPNKIYCNLLIYPNIGTVGTNIAVQNGGTGVYNYDFTSAVASYGQGNYWFRVFCHASTTTGLEASADSSTFFVGTPISNYAPPKKPGIYCGDGLKNGKEVCDGNSQSCTVNGNAGTQTCNSQCNGWNSCVTYCPSYKSILRCYDNIKDHMTAYSACPSGYSLEGILGYLPVGKDNCGGITDQENPGNSLTCANTPYYLPLSKMQRGTANEKIAVNSNTLSTSYKKLYECKIGGWDLMTSGSSNCENTNAAKTFLGYSFYGTDGFSWQTGKAIYRCIVTANGEHFDSSDINCEGQSPDGQQGVAAYYLWTAPPSC